MIVAGNWKMNMGFKQAVQFLSDFNKLIDKKTERGHFIFFPPTALAFLFQKEKLYWGGQNVYHKKEGDLTGETSAQTLKEMGACFCLLGHSERRHIFGESDVDIEKKLSLLQELALIPVLCIGENLSDRPQKNKVLQKQLSWIKNYNKYEKLPWKPDLLPFEFKKMPLIIAYEPLWSIGTGKTPSAQEIDETSRFIKEYLPKTKVFYGGSVNIQNIKNFTNCPLLDGFLIGGASLKPDLFYNIYQELPHRTEINK